MSQSVTDFDSLLASLYSRSPEAAHMEKAAEASFARSLQDVRQVRTEGSSLAGKSLDELYALAKDLEGKDKQASAKPTSEQDAELEKVAMDMMGGQIMAHAMTQEFGLIKLALANGLCRVCKQNPLDVEGSSICSACANG